MGEATRKREATRYLVVGKVYGAAGTYVGHGVELRVDHDLRVGGISRYYEFEVHGERDRKKAKDVLELLRNLSVTDTKTDTELPG